MKLKLDENGHAVLVDGKPVYVHDDGKEVPFDVESTVATIARLNNEAKTHRENHKAAATKLALYEGIEDPEAARKALKTVENLDQSKLVDAGKVEQLKTELNKTWQEKLDAETKARQTLEAQLYDEKIGGAFARSEFIAKKLAVPADMIRSTFGHHFKIEDGAIRAYDANGSPVLSRAKMGNPADFEEAIELLVDAYPHKDSILKPDQKPGSGAPPNPGGKPNTNGSVSPGQLAGSREERRAAIAARFPDLPK